MASNQIETLKTRNYDIFKFSPLNRDIDKNLVRMLVESIQKHDLLKYRPISVTSKMEVIDGQHRLMAARQLGCDIYYLVSPEMKHEDMITINNASRNWAWADYMKFYARSGNTVYQDLEELCRMLNKTPAGVLAFHGLGEKKSVDFKGGKLKLDKKEVEETYTFYEEICDLVKQYRPAQERTFLNHTGFIRALSSFFKLDGMDPEIFKKKLVTKMSVLKNCSNVRDYLGDFQNIYNWHNKQPIDLTFDRFGRLEQYDYE